MEVKGASEDEFKINLTNKKYKQYSNKLAKHRSKKMLSQRDKINLQKLLQLYNFSELRPPPDIYEINIPEQQYFVEVGGGKKRRFIYYKVPYSVEEEDKIAEVKSKMQSADIYEIYPEEIILKHLYAAEFNTKKCLERLHNVQKFQTNPTVTTLSQQTINKLKSGCVYTYGHDRNMKPLVFIQADKFDYSLSIDHNYNPVYFLMLLVLGYRTVPYHAEKYINIFDLCNMNMTEIPYMYLYEVFTAMNLYYCGNTERTFVFNAKGIGSLWTFAKKLVPEHARKKIIFVDESNSSEILKYVDPLELQKKYGGSLQNLKQYWPPKCTNEEFDAIQMLKAKNKSDELDTQSEFYSVCNDAEFFEKSEGLCGSNCNCNIF